jgi:hypothetical protein
MPLLTEGGETSPVAPINMPLLTEGRSQDSRDRRGTQLARSTISPTFNHTHGGGRPRVLLDILDVEEILSEFLLGDQVRRLLVMLGELPDGPKAGFLRALGEASELKRLDHSLSQFGHGYTSCFGIGLW